MRIYFARHGETILNAQGVNQPHDAQLSEEGIRQAKALGGKLADTPIDLIISSPFERAKQTANIIAQIREQNVRFSDHFTELKRPSIIENKRRDDPNVVEIKRLLQEHMHNPHWKHSDEETFFEFKARGLNALDELTSLHAENVLVITHGLTIILLFGLMLFGDELTPSEYLKLQNILSINNSGVTIFEYNKENWRLVTWNEFQHSKSSLMQKL